jgi:hypothetical protein
MHTKTTKDETTKPRVNLDHDHPHDPYSQPHMSTPTELNDDDTDDEMEDARWQRVNVVDELLDMRLLESEVRLERKVHSIFHVLASIENALGCCH